MTFQALRVLNAMKKASENTVTDTHGVLWGDVYIDNIAVSGLTRHQIAGYLSTLTAHGFYKPNGAYFGQVKIGIVS